MSVATTANRVPAGPRNMLRPQTPTRMSARLFGILKGILIILNLDGLTSRYSIFPFTRVKSLATVHLCFAMPVL